MRTLPTHRHPLILVVDDHPINRGILATQLDQLGLPSETADNGRSALALWREGRFDLVITDCHMPEMNGHELTQAIRKTEDAERLPRTPVFIWTDRAQGEDPSACHASGMDEVLTKPIRIAELHQALQKWLPSFHLPNTGSSPAVDFRILHEQIGTSPQLVRQFCQIFQNSAQQTFTELRQAIAMGDIVAVRNAAHRLKSPARSIGAMTLGNISAQIEEACQETNPAPSITTLLRSLEIELARVNAAWMCTESGQERT